jgi:hypothetical protein
MNMYLDLKTFAYKVLETLILGAKDGKREAIKRMSELRRKRRTVGKQGNLEDDDVDGDAVGGMGNGKARASAVADCLTCRPTEAATSSQKAK